MSYEGDTLGRIFERTRGLCHICGKTLARKNHGQPGRRGAWEVDHSRPRAAGGTGHGNNLYAACVNCNRSKGTVSSRTTRGRHGRSRAPMSQARLEAAVRKDTLEFGLFGAAIGALLWGGSGALGLGLLAAAIGSRQDPEAE